VKTLDLEKQFRPLFRRTASHLLDATT
jgi:hypothetical protein